MSPKLKKLLVKIWDMFQNLVVGVAGCILLWYILLITTFASFKIPTDSMQSAILPGDNVLVNKWIMGGRIFNLWEDLEENEELEVVGRLPAFGEVERNDVIVFNFPYPAEWDSIGLNLKTYFIKRCVALPGDTIEIKDARYRVRGIDEDLGNVEAQETLKRILQASGSENYGISMRSYPFTEGIDWDIGNFGPLYVPKVGSKVVMDSLNYALYRNVIEWEQRDKLSLRNDSVWLGDSLITEYQFKKDYYFVAGDNVVNSQDSRYWGLLPEQYIVGVATRIWKSVNPTTEEIRWNRIFKRIE